MSDILKELRDEFTEETFAEMWSQYWGYILAGMVSILIVTGLGLWVHSRYQTNRENHSLLYDKALDHLQRGESDSALEIFQQLERTTYGLLANLQKAALFAQRAIDRKAPDSLEQALSEYCKLIKDHPADLEIKGLGTLGASSLLVGKNLASTTAWKENLSEYANHDNPWQNLALEILAMHNHPGREKIYNQLIRGENTSPALRQRVILKAVGLGFDITTREKI